MFEYWAIFIMSYKYYYIDSQAIKYSYYDIENIIISGIIYFFFITLYVYNLFSYLLHNKNIEYFKNIKNFKIFIIKQNVLHYLSNTISLWHTCLLYLYQHLFLLWYFVLNNVSSIKFQLNNKLSNNCSFISHYKIFNLFLPNNTHP